MLKCSLKQRLETLYAKYNAPEHIHPDPLEFVVQFPDKGNREIAGLFAACLAYGRVRTILKSVATVLAPMEGRPREFILTHGPEDFDTIYRQFSHRFTKGGDISALARGVREVLMAHGSLERCFQNHDPTDADTILPALKGFTDELRRNAGHSLSFLLPDPEKGSALKRLNLFLRWMVRHDRVDPGGWDTISPGKLLVPLDTHIHAFALRQGLTRRKHADLMATLEVTEKFKVLTPQDPVKYDFALTRLGILERDPWPFEL